MHTTVWKCAGGGTGRSGGGEGIGWGGGGVGGGGGGREGRGCHASMTSMTVAIYSINDFHDSSNIQYHIMDELQPAAI